MKLTRVLKTDTQKQNAARFIEALDLEDGKVMTIQDCEDIRTIEQNRYLWSQVYQPCAEQIGEATGRMLTKDDMHVFFTRSFGARVERKSPVTGEIRSVPKSTTKYTRKEMSDYLEQCFAWGAEHGVWFS